jgi:formate hydrogenlyase subunit 4
MIESVIILVLAMLLAPIFSALILKTKAFFGGRWGSPILINYYTLIKLMKKGSVYSKSTTFMFKMGPIVSFSTAFTALLFLPIGGYGPVLHFNGDIIFVLYLLGLGRFFTMAAAMDTASPFEGMGAAREAFFPIICEASMFLILILLFSQTESLSLASYFSGHVPRAFWTVLGAPMIFIAIAFFIILLTENSRVPVDDPATHLELTMIHEVMVLDHSGPDLALIELGSFFKLFFYSSLVATLLCPIHTENVFIDLPCFFGALTLVYLATGVMESVMARYRMDKVPQFVLTSFALAFLAIALTLGFIK